MEEYDDLVIGGQKLAVNSWHWLQWIPLFSYRLSYIRTVATPTTSVSSQCHAGRDAGCWHPVS